MAPTAGQRLHDLIHRLEPREKAQIKRQMGANKADSKQRQLFDRLNRMETWDAEAARAFARERGISLNSAGQALTQTILTGLRTFHMRSSAKMRLNEYASWVEILYGKRLPDQAMAWIDKGIALADEHELGEYRLLFRHWRLRTQMALESRKMGERAVKRQLDESLGIARDLTRILGTLHLSHWVDQIFDAGERDYHEATRVLEDEILDHPLLAEDALPGGINARYGYLDLLASIHFYLEDWPRCIEAGERLYRFLTESGHALHGKLSGLYRRALLLGNLMMVANRLEDADRYGAYRERYDTLYRHLSEAQRREIGNYLLPVRVDLQEVWFRVQGGRTAEGLALLEERLLPVLESAGGDELRLWMLLELQAVYLRCGRWEDALACGERARTLEGFARDRGRAWAVHWMGLLAAWGLRDERLFETRHRAWSRQVRAGQGRDAAVEGQVLQGLKESFPLPDADRREALRPAREAWEAAAMAINRPTGHLDLLGWLRRATD